MTRKLRPFSMEAEGLQALVADLDHFQGLLVKGSVLLHEIFLHTGGPPLVQDLLKIDGSLPYRGKPSLAIHILDVPGFETARVFSKIGQGIRTGLGDPE